MLMTQFMETVQSWFIVSWKGSLIFPLSLRQVCGLNFEFYLPCYCSRETMFLGFGLRHVMVKSFTACINNIWVLFLCSVRYMASPTIILILIKINCRPFGEYHLFNRWPGTIFHPGGKMCLHIRHTEISDLRIKSVAYWLCDAYQVTFINLFKFWLPCL